MKITSKKSKGCWLIILDGDMTIYDAKNIKEQIVPLIEKSGDIEIDLSLVNDIDSSGLQILMLIKRELTRRGDNLRLFAHSKSVINVFELCDLANYFGDPVLISNASKNESIPQNTSSRS
jgi:anti-sigma B factor antagonist